MHGGALEFGECPRMKGCDEDRSILSIFLLSSDAEIFCLKSLAPFLESRYHDTTTIAISSI